MIQYLKNGINDKWYKVDFDDGYTLNHFKYNYEVYPLRDWWEKKIYYEYDLIERQNEKNIHTFLISHWEPVGRALGCPDCTREKVWEILVNDLSKGEITWDSEQIYHNLFSVIERYDPKKVIDNFRKQIEKKLGFDPVLTRTIKTKAIEI